MKRAFLLFLLLPLVIFLSSSNCSSASAESSAKAHANLEPGILQFNANSDGTLIYPEFRSFSVVSAFKKHPEHRHFIYQSEEGLGLISKMGAHALRFPGGSFSRKFHPQDDKGAKLIDQHIELSRKSGIENTILVLNMFAGSIEEAKTTIRKLQQGGIRIVAVELGNEYHLKKYREKYPNVEPFIEEAKSYIKALKPMLPGVRYGIPVSSSRHVFDAEQFGNRAQFFEDWNGGLAKAVRSGELPVDAVIPHFYKQTHEVYQLPTHQQRFDGVIGELQIDSYAFLEKVVLNYYLDLFGDVELWITEWGLKEKQVYGNTMAEGIHVTSFMMDIMLANQNTGNRVRHTCYQKLHGPMSNGAITPVGELPVVEPASAYKGETSWYAFTFLDEIIDNARLTKTQVKGIQNEEVRVEVLKQGDDAIIYFANRSAREYRMAALGEAHYMSGEKAWASNGQTFWNADGNYLPAKLVRANLSNTIPPYSFGYIRVPWSKL